APKAKRPFPAEGLMSNRSRSRASALVLLALSSAVFVGAAAAADLTRSFAVGVDPCDGAGSTELCTPIPTVALPTDGVLRAEFTASAGHCSDAIVHLLVDGVEVFTSAPLAPGASTGVQDFGPVTAGVHTVGVQIEGVVGGCNSGSTISWAGTLSL